MNRGLVLAPGLLAALAGCAGDQNQIVAVLDGGSSSEAAPSAQDAGAQAETGPVPDAAPASSCDSGTPECTPGATRQGACGRCGTRAETCSAHACTWSAAAGAVCGSEGICTPGDKETTQLGCTAPQMRVRACGASCAWDGWSACAIPTGWRAIASITTAGGTYRMAVARVWTGTEMIAWGGNPSDKRAFAYNPVTDAWRALSAAPVDLDAIGVWTGSAAVFLDESYGAGPPSAGLLFDPSSGWQSLPAPPLPSAPAHGLYSALFWSATNDVFAWNGDILVALNVGTKTWRSVKPPPGFTSNTSARLFAAGNKIILAGAAVTCAVYDPAADAWSESAPFGDTAFSSVASTSSGIFVWGSFQDYFQFTPQSSGSIFTLTGATGSWSPIAIPPETVIPHRFRGNAVTWSANGKLYVWGGGLESSLYEIPSGAVYDVASSAWTALPAGGPPARVGYRSHAQQALWTGTEAILWALDMDDSPRFQGEGGIFRP